MSAASFGPRIKQARKLRRWTQGDVAARAGWANRGKVSQLETGMRQPTIDSLLKLAKVFNVSTDYLLGLKP